MWASVRVLRTIALGGRTIRLGGCILLASLCLASFGIEAAQAACVPNSTTAPAPGTTVNCTGATLDGDTTSGNNGFGDGTQIGLTINVAPGASVTGTDDGMVLANDNVVNNSGIIRGNGGIGINANGALTVTNSGTISGPTVAITADDVFLTNYALGAIIGGVFANNVATVTNLGTITGSNGLAAIYGANGVNINNQGTISGTGFANGILTYGDAVIVNSGSISGQGTSLSAILVYGSQANITNSGSVTAAGLGSSGIFTQGDLTLTNAGIIDATGSQSVGVFVNGTAAIVNYGSITASGNLAAGAVINGGNVRNFGTISASGDGAIGFVFLDTGVLTNSGTIAATGPNAASIDFTFSNGGNTLNLLPGSRIIGDILLSGSDTMNIRTGRDIAWMLSFGTCGCGGLAGNTVNFAGGGVYVVSGDQIATLDTTAYGLSDRTLMDFTGAVSSLLGNRANEFDIPGSFAAATSFAPVTSNVASDAFAAMPASAYANEQNAVPNVSAFDRNSGLTVWSKAFAGGRRQPGDDVALDATNIIYGGAIGIDGMMSPYLRLGIFVGGGYGQLDIDLNSQKIATDYVFGGGYGRFDFGSHFLDFAVSVGHSSNDSDRLIANNIVAGGLETANAHYNGWYVSPELAYGIRLPFTASMMVTPTFRVRYLTGSFDGYRETGSIQNLSIGSRTLQDVEERFELAFSAASPITAYGFFKTTVTLGVLAVERLGDRTINAALLGQNIAFTAPGRSDLAGAYSGINLDYRLNARVNLFGGVEGTIMSDNSVIGLVKGGARVVF